MIPQYTKPIDIKNKIIFIKNIITLKNNMSNKQGDIIQKLLDIIFPPQTAVLEKGKPIRYLSDVQKITSSSPNPKPQKGPPLVQAAEIGDTSTQPISAVNSAQMIARNPNFKNFKVDPTVASAINQASKKYNVPSSLLYDIALQESNFNPNSVNTTAAGKQAGNPKGLFQFTDSTWNNILNAYDKKSGMSLSLPNANRQDPVTNALAAAYLIKFGQLGRWDASKNVWGQYYKPEELKPYYTQTIGR